MHNQLLLVIQLKRLLKRYNIRILIIQILLISTQLCFNITLPLETSSSPKTPIYSNIYSCRNTCFAISLTLLLIPSTPGTASGTTTTPTSMENVRVYSAITISTRVNIAYKQVTKIIKDIQAVDYQLSKLKDSLNEIKDKLVFIRYSITALICNTRLLNMEFK